MTLEAAPSSFVASLGFSPLGERRSWPIGSYRLQANARLTWYNASRQRTTAPFGAFFVVGQTIGCGYRRAAREIFFTRDGLDLGVAFNDVDVDR
jgi:hypothetical protein